MKVALVNPRWSFEGSVYFGCRESHLPLELGYAQALLAAAGHEAEIVDASAEGLDEAALRDRVARLRPDMTVVTTAPTYLFWRCPPPELRVPREVLGTLTDVAGKTVLVGPHASTSPRPTLTKLGADAAVLGECEQVVVALADTPFERWSEVPSVATRSATGVVAVNGGAFTTDLAGLPALRWSGEAISRHAHHHHRFDDGDDRACAGAEVEWSRGCPFRCTFCAKETHRDRYRKRPVATLLAEIDGLVAQGVSYLYFIDEIFLPDEDLLAALTARPVRFGVQTRIDLWSFAELDLLGAAGCVTIEAGIESLSGAGRARLDKRCRLDNQALAERLVRARQSVPFVQATLMRLGDEDEEPTEATASWKQALGDAGVWVNDPVPLFPYPGSPDYRRLWGEPDDQAWERAHAHYLRGFDRLSDIQEQRLVHLPLLESNCLEGQR